ncbi:MAG: tetratricopeptide repeat protein [Alphaproteobacteria bacterium]|nr:tetratricopeptide repeat protein [Alphaproteobacteria bacterium]MBF0393667.1 tetratricopeptide repeat protein [Alphaproteobacteria bacterium]
MVRKSADWGDIGLYAHCGLSIVQRLGSNLVDAFRSTFSLDEDIRRTYYRDKGIAHAKAGRYETAVAALEPLWTEGTDDNQLALHLGIAYVKTGAAEQGLKLLEAAHRAAPDDVKIATVLGLTYVQARQHELAVPVLIKVAEANPLNFNVRFRLGVALDNLGRFAQAIDSFKIALGLRPDEGKVHRAIAYCYEQMGQHDEALPYFKKANELDGSGV